MTTNAPSATHSAYDQYYCPLVHDPAQRYSARWHLRAAVILCGFWLVFQWQRLSARVRASRCVRAVFPPALTMQQIAHVGRTAGFIAAREFWNRHLLAIRATHAADVVACAAEVADAERALLDEQLAAAVEFHPRSVLIQ